jgi:predicted secreted acid phosphatase
MKKAVICDLDGTLCNIEHRHHLITDPEKKKRDWKAFYADMVNDGLNVWCYSIISALANNEIQIFYVTGRPEEYRSQTMDWLRRHSCPINGLYMRPSKDNRQDDIVKKEIYETILKPSYEVLFCLEDRNRVVQMWRSIGLVCLQVDEGNY